MPTAEDDQNEREFLRGWDPMVATVRQHLRQDLQAQAAAIRMRPARLRRLWHLAWLRVASDAVGVAFPILSVGALVAAVAVAIIGWPLTGLGDGTYARIVTAAGSASAFGSIVFSVTSSTFTRAADIAPGYTAVILGRRSPWLSGLGILVTSGALLVFAVFEPTRTGAVVAVLVAISAIAWSWMSARRVLADVDPLTMSQHAGDYYRRATARAARFAMRGISARWPKEIRRNEELVERLTRDHQRDVVSGLLKQIRAGVRSMAGQGRTTEAGILTEALVGAFTDFAVSTGGEIGPHDGPLDVVLTAVDANVQAALTKEDNEAANYVIRQLVVLGSVELHEPEYAACRSLVAARLQDYITRTWDNDQTTVPAAAVHALGTLISNWVAIGAFDDVRRTTESLGQVAERALLTRRKHIGLVATEELAKLLPALCAEPEASARRHYLTAWSQAVGRLMIMSPVEPLDGMAKVTDALVPGISLATTSGLQRCLWAVPVPATADAAKAVLESVDQLFTIIERADSNADDGLSFDRGLSEGLSLCYGLLAVLATRTDDVATNDAAIQVLERTVDAFVRVGATSHRDLMDSSELIWSIVLMTALVGADVEVLRGMAARLLDAIEADQDWQLPPIDAGFALAFVVGLRVLRGDDDDAIESWREEVLAQEQDMWFTLDWGFRIDGLGRAPAVNRNRVTAPQSVLDAADAAALERWPRLAESAILD